MFDRVDVTTLQGLELLLSDEIAAHGHAPVIAGPGRVRLRGLSVDALARLVRVLRFAHHVFWDWGEVELASGSLEEISEATHALAELSQVRENEPFAVRGVRVGEQTFNSVDMSRAVASALSKGYRQRFHARWPADLTHPVWDIEARLVHRTFSLRVNLVGESLAKRLPAVFRHQTPLDGALAAALVHLSPFEKLGSVFDPMLGGGTILFEAAMVREGWWPARFRSSYAYEKHAYAEGIAEVELPHCEARPMKLGGADRFGGRLAGARQNLIAAGLGHDLWLVKGNAFHMAYLEKDAWKNLVCNPPYGVRELNNGAVTELYHGWARAAAMKGVTSVTAVTPRHGTFRKAFEEAGYVIGMEHSVLFGDMPVFILQAGLR